jgi:hypothetical protein
MLDYIAPISVTIMIISLGISNLLRFQCSRYLSGKTLRELSPSKISDLPSSREMVRQYKSQELKDPKARLYIKWHIITFRIFYLSLFFVLVVIVVSNL